MSEHFRDCKQPSWRIFATIRRWYFSPEARRLEAVVYEHRTCSGCGALSTLAWSVERCEVVA